MKDPDGDAVTPASMPDGGSSGRGGGNHDRVGQQGGTRGGGKDNSPP